MNKWLRYIILAGVIILLAAALWFKQDLLFSNDQNKTQSIANTSVHAHKDASTITQQNKQGNTINKDKKEPTKVNKNAAAEGLSRFYANLHGDGNEDGPTIRNNIIYLPDPKGDITEVLKALAIKNQPLRSNWTGNTETHPFRKGETLFQKLSKFGQDNGIEIIWWVNRDLVVKDTFRINEDIIKTSYQIGKAIEGHLENGIRIYFCHKQSAIVFIDKNNTYIAKECLLLPRN